MVLAPKVVKACEVVTSTLPPGLLPTIFSLQGFSAKVFPIPVFSFPAFFTLGLTLFHPCFFDTGFFSPMFQKPKANSFQEYLSFSHSK